MWAVWNYVFGIASSGQSVKGTDDRVATSCDRIMHFMKTVRHQDVSCDLASLNRKRG
jgi:hypothetical protein